MVTGESTAPGPRITLSPLLKHASSGKSGPDDLFHWRSVSLAIGFIDDR